VVRQLNDLDDSSTRETTSAAPLVVLALLEAQIDELASAGMVVIGWPWRWLVASNTSMSSPFVSVVSRDYTEAL